MSGFSFGTSGTTGAPTAGSAFSFGGGAPATTGFGSSGTGFGNTGFGNTIGAPAGGTGNPGFSFGGGAPATTGFGSGGTGFGNTGFGNTTTPASTGFNLVGTNTGAGLGGGAGGFGFGNTPNSGFGNSGFGTGGSAFGTGGAGVLGGINNGQAGIQWPGTQAGIRAGSNPHEKINTLVTAYGNFQHPRQGQQHPRQGRFQCVMYNKSSDSRLSEQYRRHPEMFKPQGFPDHMWDAANRHNPDPDHLIPAAVRTYAQLKQRAVKHAEGLQAIEGFCAKVERDLAEMRTNHEQTVKKDIASLKQQQVRLTERLLKCLRKLMVRETAPLNGEELTLKRRLQLIHKQLSHPADFTSRIEDLMSSARMNKRARRANLKVPDEKNMARMLQFLKEQQQILKELMGTTQKDMRDLSIISRELSSQVPAITQY